MSGIIDKKGKESVSKNPYYMISLSGAYDSQSFWKAKDIEETDNILNKPGLDCIYTDCTDILGSLYFCSDEAKTELEKRLAHIPVNALHFIDSPLPENALLILVGANKVLEKIGKLEK